ncbi:MAG: DNA-processing protein DprA [Clostridiales bacterium]|nr:DNA-processing protein DprA [Candidatus Equinaster intestinalis]
MGAYKMTEHYILLQRILGIGSKKVKKVIEKYHGAEAVFEQNYDDLRLCGLFTALQTEKIKKADMNYARKVLNDCNNSGIAVIPFASVMYPALLAEIPDPPLVLYAKGNLDLLNEPAICIVGPRKVTEFGKKAAFSLSARLAAGGFTVVSGGAVGSDTAVHLGALAVEGNTICVYPSGLNSSYLKANKELRDKIAANGLLISECPPDTELMRGMIPVRNRIMSGISVGVAVVEAPIKSGALITANMAAEQNRDVFAVPGEITNINCEGSNKLIEDGAVPLTDARIIFSEYERRFEGKLNAEKAYGRHIIKPAAKANTESEPKTEKTPPQKENKPENIQKNINYSLSKTAEMVYNNLDKQNFSLDEISRGNLTTGEILAAITELEIKGAIRAVPGGRYEIKN